MAELDAFDPTHALDGWRPPAPVPLQDMTLGALLQSGGAELGSVPQTPLTRAETVAFDPTHLLDGWRPPAAAPLDLEFKSLARAGRSGPDEAKKARLKARGYEMLDVEDIELPERRLPSAVVAPAVPAVPDPLPPPIEAAIDPPVQPQPAVVEPPPTVADVPVLDFQAPLPADPDPQQVLEDIQLPDVSPSPVAVEAPVLDFRASPPPAVVEAPSLDLPSFAARAESEPRLLAHYQPGAWTAVARRVRGASAEVVQTPSGPRVESYAPQWLCALWPPQPAGAPLLGRWPEMASLVPAETAFGALHQLLADVPPEARLWPAEMEVDWALVAELVLHQGMGSRPAQAQALRELVEAERRASAARVDEGYARQGHIARRRA